MIAPPNRGVGEDVAYSGGRRDVLKQVAAMGRDDAADLKSHGYVFVVSLDALKSIDASQTKVVMLNDDTDMPIKPAVDDAARVLGDRSSRTRPSSSVLVAIVPTDSYRAVVLANFSGPGSISRCVVADEDVVLIVQDVLNTEQVGVFSLLR